jgi:mono/diheme cytochrome c family protein
MPGIAQEMTMKTPFTPARVIASLLAVTANAWALTPLEKGRIEYDHQCASCHGTTAKGDGPLRPFLVKAPSDLTTLAQRHGGKLPEQQVREMIDGRGMNEPGPHGSREMPVWGQRFREDAQETRMGRWKPERQVRQRLDTLVTYLQSVQVK